MLRSPHDPHAHGSRGPEVDQLLRGRQRLHSQPRGDSNRAFADSHRHDVRQTPSAVSKLQRRLARQRNHHRRSTQAGRLCFGRDWQVAPGASPAMPAHVARIRNLLGHSLFQRHGCFARVPQLSANRSRRSELCRQDRAIQCAADSRHKGDRTPRRSKHDHATLHRQGHRVH